MKRALKRTLNAPLSRNLGPQRQGGPETPGRKKPQSPLQQSFIHSLSPSRRCCQEQKQAGSQLLHACMSIFFVFYFAILCHSKPFELGNQMCSTNLPNAWRGGLARARPRAVSNSPCAWSTFHPYAALHALPNSIYVDAVPVPSPSPCPPLLLYRCTAVFTH